MRARVRLVKSLDQLVTVYRHLLEIVRKESEVLQGADLAQIPKVNEAKEKMVLKIRQLDSEWMKSAEELAKKLKLNNSQPTLLELSSNFSGEEKNKLEQLHSVLNMLVQRIAEINKKNEVLVQSALSHITGAMDSITGTLNENPTYKNSGGMEEVNKDAAGRLVQREA
ncbi:MAG: flagellar protein FlgN [Bdellovibrionales bacterium]|nr:flagellar protein FlgN [Bdellovibrionales bacterium]NQZ18830.1 flagellar protein FlgN [Bdellovibrionales bacterium]